MTRWILCMLLILSISLLHKQVFACTTTAVGKDVSADGSVMVSHSCDGFGDSQIVFVPSQDHAPGTQRPVFYSASAAGFKPEWGGDQTHRIVSSYFGPAYDLPGIPKSVPLGYVPEVAHTFAYFRGRYGIINERQLLIGECTDKAKVHPSPEPGKRIMYSAALSAIALERCSSARKAVLLMGGLIERYGYYGTGETLIVADPEEAWVMEMCGYDKDGTDGVWVAQRVPDNGFFVAANQFRIREIRRDAPDMLYGKHVFDAAKAKGWWKPEDGPLDWTSVYGDGEFHHPYYSLRRVWRAFSMAAPSKNLPAWVDGPFTKAYPFSMAPDNKLNVENVFDIHRDSYEGTEFDMSKGLAAGPFNDPNRFEGGSEAVMDKEKKEPVKGAFERPLNIYRCAYAYVNQARKNLPDAIGGISWIGLDRPANAALLPFYCGALDLPVSLQRTDPLVYDEKSLWMVFNYVGNYAMLRYSYMIKDITALRKKLEAEAFGRQKTLEDQAKALWDKGEQQAARMLLTKTCNTHAESVRKAWWKLSHDLYIKYNDGYVNTPEAIAQKQFYPAWWLREVGYENGPLHYQKQPGEH